MESGRDSRMRLCGGWQAPRKRGPSGPEERRRGRPGPMCGTGWRASAWIRNSRNPPGCRRAPASPRAPIAAVRRARGIADRRASTAVAGSGKTGSATDRRARPLSAIVLSGWLMPSGRLPHPGAARMPGAGVQPSRFPCRIRGLEGTQDCRGPDAKKPAVTGTAGASTSGKCHRCRCCAAGPRSAGEGREAARASCPDDMPTASAPRKGNGYLKCTKGMKNPLPGIGEPVLQGSPTSDFEDL